MRFVPSTGKIKHEIGGMRWKTCSHCQGWETCGGKRVASAKKILQSVSSAGKDAVAAKGGKEVTGAKLGKARIWGQARENTQSAPSAGKHNRGQARENK